MAITDYTTYDDIRAVLGVEDDELLDATIGLSVYENTLSLALAATSGVLSPSTETRDLAEQYEYISGLGSPTDDETQMLLTIENYACYIVAAALASSLPMFAPKIQSDGKSTLTRFASEETYKSAQRGIWEMIAKIKGDFIELFGGTIETGSLLVAVAPDEDLVTGET